MQREDVEALLRRHEEGFRRRDPAALAADYDEHAVVVSPMFPNVEGRAAVERSFISLFDIFPDWDMAFEPPLIDGLRACQYCTVRATQVGAFMGISGTGRRFEFLCVLGFEFAGGSIVRERRVYDFTGMLIQLGILRGKPAL